MKKMVLYSYLLDRERSPKSALIASKETGMSAVLRSSIEAAKKARKHDCYDGGHKPGPIVKITLEMVEE